MTDIMFLYTKGFEIETSNVTNSTGPEKYESLDGVYAIHTFSSVKGSLMVLQLNDIPSNGLNYARLSYLRIENTNSGICKFYIPEQIFNVISDTYNRTLDKLLENIPVISLIALYDHRSGNPIDGESNFPPSPFPDEIKEKDSLMDLLLDWTNYWSNNYGSYDSNDYIQYWYPQTCKNQYCSIMQQLNQINGSYSGDIVKEPYFILGEKSVVHYATKIMGLLEHIPDFVLNIINNNKLLDPKYIEVFMEYNQKHDEFVRSIASFKEQHSQLMKKVI